MKLLSPSRIIDTLFGTSVDDAAEQAPWGAVRNAKGKIPASWSGSGNWPIQQAHETSTSVGAKTHRGIQPPGNRNAALQAGDAIAYDVDENGNRWVAGKFIDAGGSKTDAEWLMGLRPVAPGNTLAQSADTEQSTNSASYIKLKEFFDARPGKWRLVFDLARTGGTAKAVVKLRMPDGSYIDASAEATLATTTYPTFTTKTLDMTIEQWWGGTAIAIFLLNDSGPGQTSYIANVKLKYQDATASLSPYGAVLLD